MFGRATIRLGIGPHSSSLGFVRLAKFSVSLEVPTSLATPMVQSCSVHVELEMWANVQTDGRPAEYR